MYQRSWIILTNEKQYVHSVKRSFTLVQLKIKKKTVGKIKTMCPGITASVVDVSS